MSVPGLRAAAESLIERLTSFEPGLHPGDDCAALVSVLARLEKVCAAARARAAVRAASCGAVREKGFVRASDWLACETGTSLGEAERALELVSQLDALPATRDAVVAGELSVQQAQEIAATVAAGGATEHQMLEVARSRDLRGLRDEGRKRRLAAVDVEQLHARQRAARSHRHWRDEHGMIRYSGALPPDVGVPMMKRVEIETDRAWRAARSGGGMVEPRERLAADAVARLITEGGTGRAPRADVVFVHEIATGTSHILGGGPVPVSTVRAALAHGFVKAVLHDGTKIDTVAHYGRRVPAVLRTALELGDPPAFDGVACVDCGRQLGLEWDHLDPIANGGITALGNLRARCKPCHADKTERDRRAGLLGPSPPPARATEGARGPAP